MLSTTTQNQQPQTQTQPFYLINKIITPCSEKLYKQYNFLIKPSKKKAFLKSYKIIDNFVNGLYLHTDETTSCGYTAHDYENNDDDDDMNDNDANLDKYDEFMYGNKYQPKSNTEIDAILMDVKRDYYSTQVIDDIKKYNKDICIKFHKRPNCNNIGFENYLKILTKALTENIKIENNENFYLAMNPKNFSIDAKPSSESIFFEYKHLLKRSIITNILYNPISQSIVPLVLPEECIPQENKIIIMQYNFIKLSDYHGYFKLESLIVRIYSKYLLSAKKISNLNDREVGISNIEHISSLLCDHIERFMHNLGFLSCHFLLKENQIIGYNYKDSIVAVIGSVNNFNIAVSFL